MRKTYSPAFKTKVALEALREVKTMAELSSDYEIHRAQVTRWKKEAEEGLVNIFSKNFEKIEKNEKNLIEQLYAEIGQLKFENRLLQKKKDL